MAFNWDREDPAVLRQMMTRAGIDLETAAQVFFNGTPERFNRIAKTDLLPEAKARCNLLDSIHRRIVCGFYLPDAEVGLGRTRAQMREWINRQIQDGAEGRAGRWMFDLDMLEQNTGIGYRPLLTAPIFGKPASRGLGLRLKRLFSFGRKMKPVCELDS